MPKAADAKVNAKPNNSDTRKPYKIRANTSRPWSSVPSQFCAVGAEGTGTAKSKFGVW